MFTTPKTFSEVMMERSQVAKAIGDTEEAAWCEGVAQRTSAKSAERIAKTSAVERAGNILATRIGMAKPPSAKEELSVDELDAAVTYALRRVYGNAPANTEKFDKALESVAKVDPGQVNDWIEKSYPVDDEVDFMKRQKIEETLDELAGKLREKDPKLSYDQAIVKAVEENPRLYALHSGY